MSAKFKLRNNLHDLDTVASLVELPKPYPSKYGPHAGKMLTHVLRWKDSYVSPSAKNEVWLVPEEAAAVIAVYDRVEEERLALWDERLTAKYKQKGKQQKIDEYRERKAKNKAAVETAEVAVGTGEGVSHA